MSNTPAYSSPSQSLVRPPLSKASLASLILGIVFCLPLFTSLAAIVFAIAGFRATRNGATRGRGFAAAGLTLGIIGTLCWIATGGFVLLIIGGSQAPRAVLHDFAAKFTSGNIPAATALCDPSITSDQLDKLHTQIVPFGTYSDLTCYSVNLQALSSETRCMVSGTIPFSTGPHTFNAILVKRATGDWKILGFHIF